MRVWQQQTRLWSHKRVRAIIVPVSYRYRAMTILSPNGVGDEDEENQNV